MVQEQVTTGFSTYNKINIPCDIQSLFINEIYDTMVYRFLSEWRKMFCIIFYVQIWDDPFQEHKCLQMITYT